MVLEPKRYWTREKEILIKSSIQRPVPSIVGEGPYLSTIPPMKEPAIADTRRNSVTAEEKVPFDQPNSVRSGSSIRVWPKNPIPDVMVRMAIPPIAIHHP